MWTSSWKLAWRGPIYTIGVTALPCILVRLVLPYWLHPAKLILDFTLLEALQLAKELHDGRTWFISAALVLEGVVLRSHSNALDWDKGCCSASSCDFGEAWQLFIFDLQDASVVSDRQRG